MKNFLCPPRVCQHSSLWAQVCGGWISFCALCQNQINTDCVLIYALVCEWVVSVLCCAPHLISFKSADLENRVIYFYDLHALQIHLTQLILSNVSLLIQGGKQSVDTRLTCFEHTIYLCFCKYCTAEVRKIDPKKNHLNSLFHSLALSWKGTVAELIID